MKQPSWIKDKEGFLLQKGSCSGFKKPYIVCSISYIEKKEVREHIP